MNRDPAYMPSSRSQRSIDAALRRRAAADRTLHLVMALAAVIAGVLLVGASLFAFGRRFALLGVLLVAVGCSFVPAEAKKELQDSNTVTRARLKVWASLSESERETAYRECAQAFVDLDFSIFQTPIPEGFVAPKKDGPK